MNQNPAMGELPSKTDYGCRIFKHYGRMVPTTLIPQALESGMAYYPVSNPSQ